MHVYNKGGLLFQVGLCMYLVQDSVGFLRVVLWALYFYVYDLPDVIQSSLWLFADNSKIFRSITSVEDSNYITEVNNYACMQ